MMQMQRERVMELEKLEGIYGPLLCQTSDLLWEYHEVAYEEWKSSSLLKRILEEHGFRVTVPVEDLPTAFCASFGSGKPVIGLLGEYDALLGMAQEADADTERLPKGEEMGAPGHGCGHNLLGTGLLGTALYIKDILKKEKCSGTILYFGCPAEENFAGKAKMVEKGMFEGVDAVFSWHPNAQSGIWNQSLANQRVVYRFHGISAHASQAPHLGRSALDACELMNIGVNYLREHMIDEARVHYAYLNAGGTLPNVVPAEAELLYAIRAPKSQQVQELRERIDRIARGAALMTDTEVEIETRCIYDSLLPNPVLDSLILNYLEQFQPSRYSEEESSYAARFVPYGNQPGAEKPIQIEPDLSQTRKTGISTDVGNVSQIVPATAFMVNCYAAGSPLHHWTVTAQGKSSIAKKGMLAATKILTASIWELFREPELVEKVKRCFWEQKRT